MGEYPHGLTLTDDGDGWDVAECACGWTSPPCPEAEIAAEFYADHLVRASYGNGNDG